MSEISEVGVYKETLQTILQELRMFNGIRFADDDLRSRMQAAQLLKVELITDNALQHFRTRVVEAKQ